MKFHPTTAPEEARALTAACLQVIASGWPVLYFKISNVNRPDGTAAQATPDVPAMISAAADMAAELTHAVDHRIPMETPDGNH